MFKNNQTLKSLRIIFDQILNLQTTTGIFSIKASFRGYRDRDRVPILDNEPRARNTTTNRDPGPGIGNKM